MPAIEHEPECTLNPVHWLRHAIAALGRLAAPVDDLDNHVDQISAVSLSDTLAHFAELPEWRSVTLHDIARQASLMDERFDAMCTCGASSG